MKLEQWRKQYQDICEQEKEMRLSAPDIWLESAVEGATACTMGIEYVRQFHAVQSTCAFEESDALSRDEWIALVSYQYRYAEIRIKISKQLKRMKSLSNLLIPGKRLGIAHTVQDAKKLYEIVERYGWQIKVVYRSTNGQFTTPNSDVQAIEFYTVRRVK